MLPTFFLAGVPKAGTTALYAMLGQHPDVYMSPHKEPNFFAYPEKPTPVSTRTQYEALFDGVRHERVVGEASTDYFHHPQAPQRILDLVPDARAAVVLRDPVERAYSHYAMLVRSGAVPQRPYRTVLEEAVQATGGDLARAYGTGVRQSLYAESLERYLTCFGRDRFRVYLYDDFKTAPLAVVCDLFAFLGVDDAFRPQLARRNTSSQPRSAALHHLLRRPNALRFAASALLPTPMRRTASAWIHRRNQEPVAPLEPAAREILSAYFASDVERVEAILNRDLARWKASDSVPSTYRQPST